MEDVRSTMSVLRVLKVFVDELGEPQHGYRLMKSTGFSSAKTYQILTRLHTAGWLDRSDDPDASPESGGPPRITYTLRGAAVPKARHLLAEAQKEIAPARRRRGIIGGATHTLGWAE